MLTHLEMEQVNEWRQVARLLEYSIAANVRAQVPFHPHTRYDICMRWRRAGLHLIGYLEADARVDDMQDLETSIVIWGRGREGSDSGEAG